MRMDLGKNLAKVRKEAGLSDEFNIHSEKEADLQILDWDRTYFLTKHYFI